MAREGTVQIASVEHSWRKLSLAGSVVAAGADPDRRMPAQGAENPSKETEQPDKVLFDKAIKDIEKGRYEVARLTFKTLINTYDSSEFLAKAKLAIADSWMRAERSRGMRKPKRNTRISSLFYPKRNGRGGRKPRSKICEIP